MGTFYIYNQEYVFFNPYLFCSVEFPQLFHRYPGMATGENNASSCLGCTMAVTLNATIVCKGKIQQISRVTGNQSIRGR